MATSAIPSPAAQSQAAAQAGGQFVNAALYVGDLDATVTEGQLYDMFNQVAHVVSVRVCRDQENRVSLGYAYVNFSTPAGAATAREVLNFTPINGRPIRIMFSHRDPNSRKNNSANIFIKNLDSSIDNKALYDTFAKFGNVLSCKVALDSNGRSKGYGFVQYEQEEAAQNAISTLNGMLMNDKQVYVGLFIRQQERSQVNGSPKFTNIYVKNISETFADEDLKIFFSKFGPITSAVVMRDANGKSKCFGFVNFEKPEDAASAVESLNGTLSEDDKVLYVGRAQRKSEREAELRARFEQERKSRFEKLQGANLYMKNLDDSISDEKLKELFSEFGTITSCKVMLDPQGISKGCGFVAFATPEEASRAMNEMNGKMVGRKPLYIAVAQRKEDRSARLQAHFAQIRAPGVMAPLAPGIQGFHPGAPPRLAPQQLYFGQGVIPPHPGYGFQQQLLPGMRPGVHSNFMMPYQLQRQPQPGQRFGGRRVGNPQQMQQQQLMYLRNSNQGYSRYMNNARNGLEASSMVPQGGMGTFMPMSFDGSVSAPSDVQRSGPVPTLASALASATPEKQREMLGEHLFPLVENIERDNAGKVTGMLLEMDQPEVLHLIEAPDALKKKVAEAMDVLRPGSDIIIAQ